MEWEHMVTSGIKISSSSEKTTYFHKKQLQKEKKELALELQVCYGTFMLMNFGSSFVAGQ